MNLVNKDDLLPILQNSDLADQFEDKVAIPKQFILTENDYVVEYKLTIKDENHFHEITK